jgi:hypothetical protein
MGVVEGLSLSKIATIVYVLGPFGLILILWWVDQRRMDSIIAANKKEVHIILTAYKEDVEKVSAFYHRNVTLVENYEKLSGDLANIITLNTQVQTRLVERIDSNMFCPILREKGPSRN